MLILLFLATFLCADHKDDARKYLEKNCNMPSIWTRVFADTPRSFHHRCEKAVHEVKHLIEDGNLSHEQKKELKMKVKEASHSLKTSYHYHKKTPTPLLVKTLRKVCGWGTPTMGAITGIHAYADKNRKNDDYTAGGAVLTIILLSAYGAGKLYNHEGWINAFHDNYKTVTKITKD